MNRQQFLAELNQYLTFVTPDERTAIIGVFTEKFDEVGEEGEAALIMDMGTPMSIAIALKRKKESGEFVSEQSAASEPPVTPSEVLTPLDPAQQEEAAIESEIAAVVQEAVAQEAPEAPAEPEVTPTAPAEDPYVSEEPVVSEPVSEPMPEPVVEEHVFDEVSIQEHAFEESPAEAVRYSEIPGINSGGTAPQIDRPEPAPREKLTAGRIIGGSLMSIIVTAVALVIAAVGGYMLFAMFRLIFGGLQTMSTLTDALFMFAFGFILGAIGLLIVWFAFLFAASSIRRLFFGAPDEDSAYKRRMKKIRKTVVIIFIVFAVLGIACLIIPYVMGGRPEDLFENSRFNSIVDWFSTKGAAQLISGFIK